MDSGLVKRSHHAVFDEAWYLQQTRPPAAQMLYDLGLERDDRLVCCVDGVLTFDADATVAEYPPLPPDLSVSTCHLKRDVPLLACITFLPLRSTEHPSTSRISATADEVNDGVIDEADIADSVPPGLTTFAKDEPRVNRSGTDRRSAAARIVDDFGITQDDMAQVYLSPCPYHAAFEEELDLRKYSYKHPAAGLGLVTKDERLLLEHMVKGNPAARIRCWRSRLRGAWQRQTQ